MRDKETCQESKMRISPSCMSAEVNKVYMPLWLSNNKPAISCRLQAFGIRMTQHLPEGSRTPLHSFTRASLKEFRRNNSSFQGLLFLITFLVIAVSFLWLFQQWDTAAWGWSWLHNSYKTILHLLWEVLITSPFPPNLSYLATLK